MMNNKGLVTAWRMYLLSYDRVYDDGVIVTSNLLSYRLHSLLSTLHIRLFQLLVTCLAHLMSKLYTTTGTRTVRTSTLSGLLLWWSVIKPLSKLMKLIDSRSRATLSQWSVLKNITHA